MAGDNGIYTLNFGCGAAATPSSGQTYYPGWNQAGNWATHTTQGRFAVIVPRAGTIESVTYHVYGAAGDTNNVTCTLFINGTTTAGSDSFAWTSFPVRRPTVTVSQAVAKDAYIEVRVTCPTWATPPTGVFFFASAQIKTTF